MKTIFCYSEAIDNAAWTKSNLTVVANTHIAPNGTMTADTLKSTTTPAIFSECIQPSTLTTVVWNKYTYSAYVKSLWQQFVQILWNVAAFNLAAVNFDIINGTVTQTAVSPFAWSITPEANWYFRVSATFTCTWVLATGRMSIWFIDTGTSARGSVYNGDGVKAIAIWGQQYNDTTLNTVRDQVNMYQQMYSLSFHGANVDWCKYFDTDANWVAIPKQHSNDCLLSEQEQIYVHTVICPQLDGAFNELQELHSLEQLQTVQTQW